MPMAKTSIVLDRFAVKAPRTTLARQKKSPGGLKGLHLPKIEYSWSFSPLPK